MNEKMASRRRFLLMMAKTWLMTSLMFTDKAVAQVNKTAGASKQGLLDSTQTPNKINKKIDQKTYEKWLDNTRIGAEKLAHDVGSEFRQEDFEKYVIRTLRALEKNGYTITNKLKH